MYFLKVKAITPVPGGVETYDNPLFIAKYFKISNP